MEHERLDRQRCADERRLSRAKCQVPWAMPGNGLFAAYLSWIQMALRSVNFSSA